MRTFPRLRTRRRGLAAILIGLIAALVVSVPALASLGWCRADPIVRLNGAEVQIWVAIPEQYRPLVNGPIDVTIKTPEGVTREVVMLDSGFNGYGEIVTFEDKLAGWVKPDGSFPMKVKVRVPMNLAGMSNSTLIPVEVEVIPENGNSQHFTGTHHVTSFTMPIQGSN